MNPNQSQNQLTSQGSEIKDDIDIMMDKGECEQIYTYETEYPNYAISFRNKKDNKFQMAVGSYNTDSIQNHVDIIDLEFKKPNDGFKKIGGFNHQFPATKIMYMPDYGGYSKDIIATTAEYLRLWELDPITNVYNENVLRNVSL